MVVVGVALAWGTCWTFRLVVPELTDFGLVSYFLLAEVSQVAGTVMEYGGGTFVTLRNSVG